MSGIELDLNHWMPYIIVITCVGLAVACYHFGYTEGAVIAIGIAGVLYTMIKADNNSKLKETASANNQMLTKLLNAVDGKAFCIGYDSSKGITCDKQQPTSAVINEIVPGRTIDGKPLTAATVGQ